MVWQRLLQNVTFFSLKVWLNHSICTISFLFTLFTFTVLQWWCKRYIPELPSKKSSAFIGTLQSSGLLQNVFFAICNRESPSVTYNTQLTSKPCRVRSDCSLGEVWSGSTLFDQVVPSKCFGFWWCMCMNIYNTAIMFKTNILSLQKNLISNKFSISF